MTQAAEFDIGSEVDCTDGTCGHLTRIVVDPVARSITHIVVESWSRRGSGRLVPIDFVASGGAKIQLNRSMAQFEALEEADETDFLRFPSDWSGYEDEHVLSWPFYGLHSSAAGVVSRSSMSRIRESSPSETITHHQVPLGEVEVRRGEHVEATDGPIGRVHGLVIDPQSHHVTHFLLEEGHLWGHKTVAIPIGAVTRVGEVIRLSLSRDQIRDLPPVDIDHPG